MTNKYRLVKIQNNEEITKEYRTLKEISDGLGIEIHIIRKINHITEGRISHIKPHYIYKDIYETTKIYNITKEIKNI